MDNLEEELPMDKLEKELMDRLKQELDATTDTREIIRLGNFIAKLTKKFHPAPIGRPPKPKPAPVASSKPSAILHKETGTAVDVLVDGARIAHHLVLLAESKCKARGGWLRLSKEQQIALLEEVKTTLSDGEREVLEAYAAAEAEAAKRASMVAEKGC